jgi:hypothetical protein
MGAGKIELGSDPADRFGRRTDQRIERGRNAVTSAIGMAVVLKPMATTTLPPNASDDVWRNRRRGEFAAWAPPYPAKMAPFYAAPN